MGGGGGSRSFVFHHSNKARIASWQSAGLEIGRLRVRIPAEAAGGFSSPELTLRADSYSVSVPPPPPTPRVTTVAHKKPYHSAKSAGGKLHLKSHTPSIQRSRNGLAMPLSRHSVGTSPKTSSHATCQGTFGHSRLSTLSHCGLILP